ncbi:alpha/beta hydrolase fold domain-containing protein [Acidobacteria bacterium AH-259-A15]|nr:alpha/beta hydrolase fold domain-containing protein [Acidobacteria bacterium AH-259-A15]
MLGKTISHYKILEKIGQGGTGEDTNLGREVAIKNRRLPMILRLSRRKFWRDLAVGVASVAMCVPAFGQDETIRTQTYTYKTVSDLEIKLDVHRLDDDVVRPVVLWIHGGALINGHRGGMNRVKKMMLEAGYAIVSIDYRLAPETKLPAIIEDLEDAFTPPH